MPQSVFGVQLYTVRTMLEGDASRAVRALAEMGYQEVELLEHHLDRLVPLVRDVGLTPVSVHIEALGSTGDTERRFDAVSRHGLRHVVLAWLLPHERGEGLAFWQRTAEWLNEVGRRAANVGLAFGYHNHAFEFLSFDDDRTGPQCPFDVLVERLDPQVVSFELDVFWAEMAGVDPVGLLRRLSGRVPLLHLKDRDARAAREMDETKVKDWAFAEVGSGTLDVPAILAAVRHAGVEHVFVEQDHTLGNPLTSLRRSYEYLTTVRIG